MAVTFKPVETPARRELQKLAGSKKGLEFGGDSEIPLAPPPSSFPDIDFEGKLTQDVLTGSKAQKMPVGEAIASPTGLQFPGTGTRGGAVVDAASGANIQQQSRLYTALQGLEELSPETLYGTNGVLAQFWPTWEADLARSEAQDISTDAPEESMRLREGYKTTVNETLAALGQNPDFVQAVEDKLKPLQLEQNILTLPESDFKSSLMDGIIGGFARGEVAQMAGNRQSPAAAMTAVIGLEIFDDLGNQASQMMGMTPELIAAQGVPGQTGEAARLTMDTINQSPLGRWLNGESTDDEFIAALLTTMEERSFAEATMVGVGSPLNLLPMPIFDDLARIVLGSSARALRLGGRFGGRSLGDVLRLSHRFTSAMSSRGRDLLGESFLFARGGVARAEGRVPDVPTSYGPEGPGQFRRGVVELEELPEKPVDTQATNMFVSVRKGIGKAITKSRAATTDTLAHAQNVQNEIERYVKKQYGRALHETEKFGVKMSLLRAGVHDGSMKRYLRYTDEMAGYLKSYDGEAIPSEYSLRLLVLKHHEEILKMHPEKQGPEYTLQSVQEGLAQLQEEIAQRFDPKQRGVGTVRDTGWARVIQASSVIARAYHEMLMESVQDGFITHELGSTLYHTYPWYNPVRFLENQQIDGLELITKQGRLGEDVGQRIPGADGVTIHFLSEQSWDIYKQQENPLALLQNAILRHEQRRRLNDTVKSIVKALRTWEWDSVNRTGTLVKEYNMADVPSARIDPETGQMTGVFGDLGKVQVKVPRPRARRRPTAGGTADRPIGGRRADTTEVAYWDEGVPVFHEIPSDLFDVLEALIRIPNAGRALETALRFIQYPKRAAVTIYNPAFMAGNFIFEMFQLGFVHGILPHHHVINLGRAFKNIVVEEKLIEEMYEQNAVVLGFTRTSIRPPKFGEGPGVTVAKPTFKEDATVILRNQRDWKRFIRNPLTGPLKFLNETASIFEISSRMTLYEDALNRGLSQQEAALAARQGMVDFAQHGSVVHLLDSVFLYLNAGVQGAKMPFVVASKRPVHTAAVLAAIPALSTAVYAHNRKFKEECNNYYDIAPRDRYGSVVVMLPGCGELQGDGSYKPRYAKIVPFLRELAIPYGATTQFLESLDEKVPHDMGMFWNATRDQIWPLTSVLPFNSRETVNDEMGVPGLTRVKYPTELFDTYNELASNHNDFTNQPILDPKDRNPNFREGLQTTPQTSTTANNMGSLLDVPPPFIDHIIKSGIGGVGADIFAGFDMVQRAAGIGTETPQSVDSAVSELLLIRELFSGTPEEIDDAQARFLTGIDFEDHRKEPDILARGIGNKKQFLEYVEAELREAIKGERKPWDSVTKRFVGQTGYARRVLARVEALEKLGYSNAQSRAAGELIQEARIVTNQAQLALDKKLEEDGPAFVYQWRLSSKYNSMLMQMEVIRITNALPDAVQGSKIDYPKYIKHVSNYMGRWPIDETRGDMLYAYWRSLDAQIYDGLTGNMVDASYIDKSNSIVQQLLEDPKPLFRLQDEFHDSLSEKDRSLLNTKRNIYTTPKRREYYADMDKLRPYWDIEDRVHAGIVSAEAQRRFGQWLAANPMQKEVLERDYPHLLDEPLSRVRAERTRLLGENSTAVQTWNNDHPDEMQRVSLDRLRMKWHIGSKPYSMEDVEYYQRMLDEVDVESIVPLSVREGILPIY